MPPTNSTPAPAPASAPAPTLLTADTAKPVVTAIQAVIDSLNGMTGPAANIRLLLKSANNIAGNIK